MMSHRYRLKPEILRFYPILPFSFPLTSLPAKIKKMNRNVLVGLDHLDGLCKLMEELSQLKDQNLHLQKRLTFLEVTPYYKHVFRKKFPLPPRFMFITPACIFCILCISCIPRSPCLYLLCLLYLLYLLSPISPIISYISYIFNIIYLISYFSVFPIPHITSLSFIFHLSPIS